MSDFFQKNASSTWSFKRFVKNILGNRIAAVREQKKISDEYISALKKLLLRDNLSQEELSDATKLYNQFKVHEKEMWKKYTDRAKKNELNTKLKEEKKRKDLVNAKVDTIRAKKKMYLEKHSMVVTSFGVSAVEEQIGKNSKSSKSVNSIKSVKSIKFSKQNEENKEHPEAAEAEYLYNTQEHPETDEAESLYNGFSGGSMTPTPLRNKEIRKFVQEFDMIVDNVNIRKVLKLHQIGGILDLTSKDNERMFPRTVWNNLQPILSIPIKVPDTVVGFMNNITSLNDMREKLDELVIDHSETWRYVRRIYEIFVDDFRLNEQLEDVDTSERTYTSKFLLPIIDGAVACVHPRLRLQWCESKAQSNVKQLKMTSALRDGRDGAQIDSVGNLSKKYDIIALEVAGPPLKEVLPKITGDEIKINSICKDMINDIANRHIFVSRNDLTKCGVVRIRAYGFRLEAALMTLEAPEVWIVRKIMTTQIPVNQSELHLLKNVIIWGLALRRILKSIVETIKTMEDREDEDEATVPWSKFIVEIDE